MKSNTIVHDFFKEQLEYLRARGIDPATTTKLGLEFCTGATLKEHGITWQGVHRGILWRVRDADGQDTGAIGARVWYTDSGFIDYSDRPKFATPKGQAPRLYHSPLSSFSDLSHGDTIVLCESYLKADVAALCGFRAVGVSGVWGWSHEKQIIADFSRYPWKAMGLNLVICFDSNVGPDGNDLLTLAVERLSAEMERYGARVSLAVLPKPEEGGDWGLDDYCARFGKEAVVQLIADAQPLHGSLSQHMLVMNREVAVVRQLSKIVDIERGVFMTRDAFVNIAYADRKVWNEDGKPISVARSWLEWPDRTVVDDVVYAPGKPRIYDDRYNVWEGMGCEPVWDDDWIPLWTHWLEHALPDEKERDWFCSWWAYQVQNLGAKMATALVLVGKSGGGKGWLAAIMRRIFGDHNTAAVDLATVGGRFNADFSTKQLMIIEESQMPSSADMGLIYNKLKDMITNERVRVERKGVDAFMVDNKMNLMLQGNRVDILKLDEFDRRFAVFDVVVQEEQDETYWDLRWEALHMGLPEAVYAWLMEYDTREFNPYGKALETEQKREMVETTRSPREQWILQLLRDPEETLIVAGTKVDGLVATAKELEYIYNEGDIPLWEIDKKAVDSMSRLLRLARIPYANAGSKIRLGQEASRYFLVRPIHRNVNSWVDEVKNRKFWQQSKRGKV